MFGTLCFWKYVSLYHAKFIGIKFLCHWVSMSWVSMASIVSLFFCKINNLYFLFEKIHKTLKNQFWALCVLFICFVYLVSTLLSTYFWPNVLIFYSLEVCYLIFIYLRLSRISCCVWFVTQLKFCKVAVFEFIEFCFMTCNTVLYIPYTPEKMYLQLLDIIIYTCL